MLRQASAEVGALVVILTISAASATSKFEPHDLQIKLVKLGTKMDKLGTKMGKFGTKIGQISVAQTLDLFRLVVNLKSKISGRK